MSYFKGLLIAYLALWVGWSSGNGWLLLAGGLLLVVETITKGKW